MFKILVIALISIQQLYAVTVYEDYQVRVFDFAPVKDRTQNETKLMNLANYRTRLDTQGLDLFVFPEYGLTGLDVLDTADLTDSTFIIPEPSEESLCDKPDIDKEIMAFSCMIKGVTKAYVVVNLLERETKNGKIYNTNVVFNRQGAIIAKYRKINLWDAEKNKLTAGTKEVTFSTDFDVGFGLITSNDIYHKHPADSIFRERNVTDVIMPTALVSTIPFYISLGVQDGYAKKNGINLIVAGLSDPNNGRGGSGFFEPGILNSLFVPTVGATQTKSGQVVILNVRKPEAACNEIISPRTSGIGGSPPGIESYKTPLNGDYVSYVYNNILETVNSGNRFEKQLCKGKLCCDFHVEYDQSIVDMVEVYKVVVSDRACGIIACDNEDDISTCGSRSKNLNAARFNKISIKVNFDNKEIYQYMPVSANYELTPIKYKYCEDSKEIKIDTENNQGLLYLGFISSESGANGVHVSLGLLSLVTIISLLFKY